MVFCTPHRLHPFSMGGTGGVNILSDRRRTDKADRFYSRICQQRVHRFLVAVDDIQHTRRRACFHHQLTQAQWHTWIFFRWLADKCIAAGNRDTKHPHRDHGGKVEWRNACAHAQRLAHGIHVDARAGTFGKLTLLQMRNTAGKFDHFEATLNVSLTVSNHLAMLR